MFPLTLFARNFSWRHDCFLSKAFTASIAINMWFPKTVHVCVLLNLLTCICWIIPSFHGKIFLMPIYILFARVLLFEYFWVYIHRRYWSGLFCLCCCCCCCCIFPWICRSISSVCSLMEYRVLKYFLIIFWICLVSILPVIMFPGAFPGSFLILLIQLLSSFCLVGQSICQFSQRNSF